MNNKKGFGLITAIIFIAVSLSTILLISAKVNYSSTKEELLQEWFTSFYLAEGGIEYGKAKLFKNSKWYTDINLAKDSANWLKEKAVGEIVEVDKGYKMKIVREKSSDEIYSLGFYKSSCVIISYENGKIREVN